ncbi:MAG: 4Fe-4S dicluster domain-containing protein [Ardenticatenales bacterium]|nr:4Fe-4S dicluster domain-containing protein [Ardenticatenales bacterium]
MLTDDFVTIRIMEQQVEVPASLTILKAIEFAGYKLTHGVGCRAGFCGACGTVYRLPGDHKLYYALACQTVVQDGMYLAQIPFFPSQKPVYDLDDLAPDAATILAIYGETINCLGCNTCTKSCPQDLQVMDYVAASLRGDIAALADLSFDCILCGLCVARCPAELVPPHVGLLGRRLYARYVQTSAPDLAERITELDDGKYQSEIAALKAMTAQELKAAYIARDIEPA